MTEEALALLERDIKDIIPEDHGYVLVLQRIGVMASPNISSNLEPEDAARTLRAVLKALPDEEV